MRQTGVSYRTAVLGITATALVLAAATLLYFRGSGTADPSAPERHRSALAAMLHERFGPREYCVYGDPAVATPIAGLIATGATDADAHTPPIVNEAQLREHLAASPRTLIIVAYGSAATRSTGATTTRSADANAALRKPAVADLHLLATLDHDGRWLAVYEHTPERSAPPPALSGRVRPAARQVNLLATGDWGQETIGQAEVAASMSLYAARQKIDAVMLVGDNFYSRLEGTDDPSWRRLFESRFDPVLLPAPFYAVLGNHDYEADKAAIQLRYQQDRPGTRWRMPAKWYRVDLPPERPLVTALMLDSNARELSPAEWAGQRRWFIEQLRAPRDGRWLAVFAHHPLFSRGMHGDDVWLQREWGELFAQHRVDLYVCGHDHDLQHLRVPERQTEFLVVGGGGAATRPIDRQGPGPFADGIHGFAHLRFGEDVMEGALVDQQGREMHMFSREKPIAR